MGRTEQWREAEAHVITVTPVARGVVRPVLASLAIALLVQLGALHWPYLHRHEALALLLLVGPAFMIVVTRTWRWRSHKIHVTNQRIVVQGGVAHRFRTSVELDDVVATRVEQRVRERMTRRGVVLVETAGATMHLGRVRHPAALLRVIDRERAPRTNERISLNTVFDFDDPSNHEFALEARRRRGRAQPD